MGTSQDTASSARTPYPQGWQLASDFDPKDHLIQLKGRDYLPVQARMLWFIRDQRAFIVAGLARMPYIIRTELVEHQPERQYAHFATYVRDVLGNEATMYGSETGKDFADYAEKASTKSLGRALLALGYGTAFAPEMDEGERVADAPQDRRRQNAQRPQQQQTAAQDDAAADRAERAAARQWERVTALATELHLSDEAKRALVDQHGRDPDAIYAALCAERDALTAQAAQAVAQAVTPASGDKPYRVLGDARWMERADGLGYRTVEAVELLLARAGLAPETATREEAEAALHAEEQQAAAAGLSRNGQSGARRGKGA